MEANRRRIETVSEYQEILFDLLVKFDSFCQEHKLRYSLDWGTLLGAVRQGDFIPWDDDCDVCMPRPDYERLLELYPRCQTADSKYSFISCRYDTGYIYPFAKFCRNDIELLEDYYKPYKLGAYIDVFPVDSIPDSKRAQRKLAKKIRGLLKINQSSTWIHPLKDTLWSKLLFKLAVFFPRLFMRQIRAVFPSRIDREASKLKFGESSFFGNLVWNPSWERMVIPKSCFLPISKKINFHGREFSVLNDPDEYLRLIYGNDYMTPPPESERVGHGFNAYYREECDDL